MSKFVSGLAVGTALFVLAACAQGIALEDDYEAARAATPEGPAFNRHLHADYMELSTTERGEYDWIDSGHFATKALSAAGDEQVSPDPIYSRRLPPDTVATLTEARKQLTSALEAGARNRTPEAAAESQTSFDCWLQEQEENHQSDDISLCRERFYAALARVQTDMGQRVASARPGDGHLVFFDFNSAKLTGQAVATVEAAAAALKAGAATKVALSGHADGVGSSTYNMELSQRRLEAVRQLMLSAGIKAEQIGLASYGDTRPRVTTRGDAAEPQNRRVEIDLLK
ncbi:MAG: OmpA family protein [Rhodospirillales bacterium]|nr:OmpA family protein [Rhodospirillales bacterium]MDH3912177.1 OmpA family protein [Rhodospirillales bacterium]MDH3918774.1 OmpA family protein [Rhodospirillales bacterium]MDH3968097.1 OmpA family protein [Rhodospirillales bacterium]